MTHGLLRIVPALVVLCLALASCSIHKPLEGQPVSGLDEKLSTYAYIEEGRLVTLVVGTQMARDRDGTGYMPLEIAIANRGMRQLPLTRESFTLRDELGNSYPLATAEELLREYQFLDFDRNLSSLAGILFNKFGANARYPSNFSPMLVTPSVVRDLVSLPKHGYMIDWLYFPEPTTGIRGHVFELFVDSPALEDPVFVKFEVR